jgi:hypothetical protein
MIPSRIIGVLAVAWAVSAASFPAAVAADDTAPLEFRVKAAYLYNFAKFVEWPDPAESGPIAFCVLANDVFSDTLDRTVKGKTVNGRAIVVRHYIAGQPIADCSVLFVADSEKPRLAGILPNPVAMGVLTVGEMKGFLAAGGMVNFILEDGKIRFEINPEAVHRGGMRISSQLLKLSRHVRDSH